MVAYSQKQQYRGIEFRSGLEVRWARVFDAIEEEWEYEPETFELADAGKYTPDFWLPARGTWFEVKGGFPNKRELSVMKALTETTGSAGVIAYGDLPVSMYEENTRKRGFLTENPEVLWETDEIDSVLKKAVSDNSRDASRFFIYEIDNEEKIQLMRTQYQECDQWTRFMVISCKQRLESVLEQKFNVGKLFHAVKDIRYATLVFGEGIPYSYEQVIEMTSGYGPGKVVRQIVDNAWTAFD